MHVSRRIDQFLRYFAVSERVKLVTDMTRGRDMNGLCCNNVFGGIVCMGNTLGCMDFGENRCVTMY